MQNMADLILGFGQWSIDSKDVANLSEEVFHQIYDAACAHSNDCSNEEEIEIVRNQNEIANFMHSLEPSLPRPGIFTRKKHAVHHEGDVMDRTVVRNNLLLKLRDKQNKHAEAFILLQHEVDFISVIERNLASQFGFG